MNISVKQYRDLLVTYLKPLWIKVLLLAAVLLGGVSLELVCPQIIRHFIDAVKAGEKIQVLTQAALLFLGVEAARQILSVFTIYISTDVGYRSTDQLRVDLIQHCLRLDLSFHNTRTSGEMIERIEGDVSALADFFSQFVPLVLGNILLLLGVLLMFFREDWRMGLIFTGFSVLTLMVFYRFREASSPLWRAKRQASADLTGFIEERLGGIEDIRANGAQGYVMRGLYQIARTDFQKGRKAAIVAETIDHVMLYPGKLTRIAAYAVGFYLFQGGAVTIGTVYLFAHYTEMLLSPLFQVWEEIGKLRRVAASIQRIEELYHTESQIVDGQNAFSPSGASTLKFENVHFRYGNGNPVLQDVSFCLKPGTVLGLLGRTGSGKTTLIRLLFRFYDPIQGTIRLNNIDISTIRLEDLRKHVGLVTQDVQLLRATIRDNLTFFDSSIGDKQILEAIDELGLTDWYASLPKGLDTELSSGGGGVSAGEAQLLAFIRVLLKDSRVIILDEASARLDLVTETLIERATQRLFQNRTGVIIAHRLRTIRQVDEIIVLENGRVLEHGLRPVLEKDQDSRFYRLLQVGMEEVLA